MPPALVHCPMCNNVLAPATLLMSADGRSQFPFRPFCSKRCKLLDLSRWLSEDYRVPGEPAGDGAGGYQDDEGLL